MHITKILQKNNNRRYNRSEIASSEITTLPIEDTSRETSVKGRIAFNALEFRQEMYEDPAIAIPFARTELNKYLAGVEVPEYQVAALNGVFDEIIKAAKSQDIGNKDELIETYLDLLDQIPGLSDNAKKIIKHSIEQTTGMILIEAADSKNSLN
jgi:hypothetical protein